jgi:prolyl-tRNA editing enzyme YbaK/EbsC (Cys-tRNA(Pro) deacylase)
LRTRGYASGVQTSWPEPVERVAAFLRKAGAEARLEEFESGTPTARAAAEAAGCALDQIVKSILVDCAGRWVLVLVPGDRRADLDKIARAAGAARGRVARPDEVEPATGFAPGAVAPFPLPPTVERVFVDHTLLTHELVWIGGGSPAHLVSIRPTELLRLSRAEPMDAVQESAYHSAPRGDA